MTDTDKQSIKEDIQKRWALYSAVEPVDSMIICPICDFFIYTNKAESLDAQCLFGGENLRRYKCPTCGAIVGPLKMFVLSKDELDEDYRLHYSVYSEGNTSEDEIFTFFQLEPTKTGKYLNYGCGIWSSSIIELRNEGYDVYGFEPYAQTSEQEHILTNLENLKTMRFDGIFTNNVLEHLPNPIATLVFMKGLLINSDSKMVHSTPCYEYLYEYTRFHLIFLTGKSLDMLCIKTGLQYSNKILKAKDDGNIYISYHFKKCDNSVKPCSVKDKFVFESFEERMNLIADSSICTNETLYLQKSIAAKHLFELTNRVSDEIRILDQSRVITSYRHIIAHRSFRRLIIFVKKAIRRLAFWYIEPVCQQQTVFNSAVTPSIGRLNEISFALIENIESLREENERLKVFQYGEMEMLHSAINSLSTQMIALKQSLDKLEISSVSNTPLPSQSIEVDPYCAVMKHKREYGLNTDEHVPSPLHCSLARKQDLHAFRNWIDEIKRDVACFTKIGLNPENPHRKVWEWAYISQALFERGMLVPGKKGLGFAVGQEPLPSLFAKYGAEIIATDLSVCEGQSDAWASSNQHASDLNMLIYPGICSKNLFVDKVQFISMDMNNIPSIDDIDFWALSKSVGSKLIL